MNNLLLGWNIAIYRLVLVLGEIHIFHITGKANSFLSCQSILCSLKTAHLLNQQLINQYCNLERVIRMNKISKKYIQWEITLTRSN